MKRNFIGSILLGLASLAGLALLTGCGEPLHEITGGTSEQEGTIKTEDCRAQIVIEEGSPATTGKKFTCAYAKSNTGKIMGGVCQAVETSGSTCSAAYAYQKKPWTKCAPGAWLTKADTCVGCPEHSTRTLGRHVQPGCRISFRGRQGSSQPAPEPRALA
jgi:hypothetical protein